MAKCQLRKMSPRGDEVVAEWDTETITPETLKAIETEFKALMKKGYFAADVDSSTLIKDFNPAADTLLIPKMQGGRV